MESSTAKGIGLSLKGRRHLVEGYGQVDCSPYSWQAPASYCVARSLAESEIFVDSTPAYDWCRGTVSSVCHQRFTLKGVKPALRAITLEALSRDPRDAAGTLLSSGGKRATKRRSRQRFDVDGHRQGTCVMLKLASCVERYSKIEESIDLHAWT